MGDNLLGMIYDVSDSDSDVSDMIMLDMLSKLRDDSSDEGKMIYYSLML